VNGNDPVDPAVTRLLDDPALWADVSSSLRDRVLAEATGGGGEPDELTRRRSVRGGRGGGPAWARPALLAAAVVVVLGLAVGGGLLASRGDDGPAGSPVALAGTENLPGATANARLRPMPAGVAVRLDVGGLPPAPEGTFYEAWVVGDQGKVSAGTFHARGDQDDVELWLGVDPADYDALTVTRQPVDGGTLAEGVVVLRGELPAGP
jgi:hypothetical protein